jgi:hypothetical protein
MSARFLFHLCAPEFRGTKLLSFNGLRSTFPDLYARERMKYAGREPVLRCVVPGLGVSWGDTVNLSVLDPRLLVAERRRLGMARSRLLSRRLLRIPMERIAGLPAVRYDARSHWLNSSPGGPTVAQTPPDDAFSAFDEERHVQPDEVPELHRRYLLRQLARDEPALGFVFVPHVLVATAIDVSGLEAIDAE